MGYREYPDEAEWEDEEPDYGDDGGPPDYGPPGSGAVIVEYDGSEEESYYGT